MGKRIPQKNCLDIQNIWLEQAIYFSISMRQFGEDKGQLTSFHNFQKVQVKDSECISSQPAMNFVLPPEVIGKLFFLVHLLLFSFYTLKIVFSSNRSILLDVYNLCIACSLLSYFSCFNCSLL